MSPAHDKSAAYWNSEAKRRAGLYEELEKHPFASAFTYGRRKLHILLERALRELDQSAEVLDIGCGTGGQLRICRELRLNVVALEPSPGLRAVAQLSHPEISIVDGSVEHLPFDGRRFDFAYAIEVLRYLSTADRLAAYRDVLRILKPGGRFFFTMANRYALDGFALYSKVRSRAYAVSGRVAPPETYFASPAEIRQELAAAGVSKVTFTGCVLAPLRIAYRVVPPLASALASSLEALDDTLSNRRWATPFAGHLVVVATRPPDARPAVQSE